MTIHLHFTSLHKEGITEHEVTMATGNNINTSMFYLEFILCNHHPSTEAIVFYSLVNSLYITVLSPNCDLLEINPK